MTSDLLIAVGIGAWVYVGLTLYGWIKDYIQNRRKSKEYRCLYVKNTHGSSISFLLTH